MCECFLGLYKTLEDVKFKGFNAVSWEQGLPFLLQGSSASGSAGESV